MKNIIYRIIKGIKFLWREYKFLVPIPMLVIYFRRFIIGVVKEKSLHFYDFKNIDEYNDWLKNNEKDCKYNVFDYNPLLSIIYVINNDNKDYLMESLDSIINQSYKNYEIIVLYNKKYKNIYETIIDYKSKYKNINIIESSNKNDALEKVKGEYLSVIHSSDKICINTFNELVLVLNKNKDVDLIYTDEDIINKNSLRCNPFFKPDFSPDTLKGYNYLGNLILYRTKIIRKIGGWNLKYNNSNDYDLNLRYIENVNGKIEHIHKILYHSRYFNSYNISDNKKVLEDYLKRNKLRGNVEVLNKKYCFIDYKNYNNPLISIIIPTKDFSDTLKNCLDSIYNKTTYKNYEIIVVNNNSMEESTFKLFDYYKSKYNNFRVIDVNTEFNYSYINNYAIKRCSGEYVVLLNNDTQVITPNWLELMLGYASLNHIGSVGVKLLYPDNTIQHCGIVIGCQGIATHIAINSKRYNDGINGNLVIPYNYSAVTAACLMIKKEKYNKVNGLTEELKVSYNDVDFNLKLLEKGYYNICLPIVELYHYESKSRGMDKTWKQYKRNLGEKEYMKEHWSLDDKFYNSNYSKNKICLLEDKEK